MKKRLAAEWEPTKGVLVAWPILLPYQLIVEFSKDTKLYLLISDEINEDDVKETLKTWGAEVENVEFIVAPQGADVNWVRDWGPHAVFTEDGECVLTSPDYRVYGTPNQGVDANSIMTSVFTEEELKPFEPLAIETLTGRTIAEHIGLKQQDLRLVMTGGNIMSDGYDKMISTEILLKENLLNCVDEKEFFNCIEKKTGMSDYSITPNYEDLGIQHVDCMFKMIDDETLFVARPPKGHKYYERYENIVNNYLSKIMTRYGRPFKIKRLDTDAYDGDELAAYSNSIILNKNIYVPLFNIAQDKIALRQWKEAMPGYTVKGFKYIIAEEPENPIAEMYTDIGWTSGDALHCRTRAIWDPKMIYMSVRRPEGSEQYIMANIVDYSREGVESAKLFARKVGEKDFSQFDLVNCPNRDFYSGELNEFEKGTEIEYFIEAKSRKGVIERMPRTAPKGLYKYTI